MNNEDTEKRRAIKRALKDADRTAREDAMRHRRAREHFEWYFLRRFDQSETKKRGSEFEVQQLDPAGRARAVLRLSVPGSSVDFAGHRVPEAVLVQLQALPPGGGDFFDAEGRRINPTTLEPVGA